MDLRSAITLIEASSQRARGTLFHGTSQYVVDEIRNGTHKIRPAYVDSNVSLGGTYMTANPMIAKVAADNAARTHNSTPVVLSLKIMYPLLPDEDWVVRMAERPTERDFDFDTDTYRDERYQGFFDDLFSDYTDGHSLSDAYVARYDALNETYGITWKDSFRTIGSVRQREPIALNQIIDIR